MTIPPKKSMPAFYDSVVSPPIAPPLPPPIPNSPRFNINPPSVAHSLRRPKSKQKWLDNRRAEIANAPKDPTTAEAIASHRSVPSWLLSFVLHLIILLMLVLIPLHGTLTRGLSLTGSLGEGEAEFSFDVGDSSENSDSTDETSPMQVGELAPELAKQLEFQSEEPTLSLVTGQMSLSLDRGVSGRTGGMKSSLLRAFGGTTETEDAVQLGLEWIVRQQKSDGSWSLTGPYSDGGVQENRPAATAMALLALVGAGHTHLEGKYQKEVAKGLKYLLKIQDSSGFFAASAQDRQQMYAQAQCSIVISELLAMTGDKTLQSPVRNAVQFAIESQSKIGGWRYYPREDADVSVTGWFVMALISGQMAGMSVGEATFKGVHKFLNKVQHDQGAQYSYLEYDLPEYSMTAEALLCRQYLGWSRDDPRLIRGCEYLLEQPVSVSGPKRHFYTWYYSTQVLHHMGGEMWQKWNQEMRVALPRDQMKAGKDAGSWSPDGDSYGISGGRMYSTCFSIYCLEVYYRHLPIYGLGK